MKKSKATRDKMQIKMPFLVLVFGNLGLMILRPSGIIRKVLKTPSKHGVYFHRVKKINELGVASEPLKPYWYQTAASM
jgi:hypothetical protein